MNITTELGKIYCKYNEEKDNFDMYRVSNIIKENDENKFVLFPIDSYTYHFYKEETDCKVFNEEEYKNFKYEYDLLESEGIVSLSNIVSIKNDNKEIKDILLIYFPNNKYTKVPDVNQPYIVARQGINNVFMQLSNTLSDIVGLSVSLDTLPPGYALSDFIANESVNDSRLAHIYKTDSSYDINVLLDNEETDKILKELFNQRVFYLSNTKPHFNADDYKGEDLWLDGYCNTLHKFITTTGFMEDVLNRMGITTVDFDIKNGEPLKEDDKLLLMTLYGGIRIDKAVPLRFSYDINLNTIKMKYILAEKRPDFDKNINEDSELYIIPYTEFSNEVPSNILYNLTEERTNQLHKRLIKCVRAYYVEEE